MRFLGFGCGCVKHTRLCAFCGDKKYFARKIARFHDTVTVSVSTMMEAAVSGL